MTLASDFRFFHTEPGAEWTYEDLEQYKDMERYLTNRLISFLGHELCITEVSMLFEQNYDRVQNFFDALWFYDSCSSFWLLKIKIIFTFTFSFATL